MKHIFLFTFGILFAVTMQAQIYWYNNLDAAKTASLKTGKLILIDFWASWCGPCNTMDQKLWYSPEMTKISNNFVAAKINVDNDRSTALYYQATAIPKVIIASADGEVIWESTGFSGAEYYLKVLRTVPPDVSALYQTLNKLGESKNSASFNLLAGIEYQHLAQITTNENLRNAFLIQGLRFFKKASKNSDDPAFSQQVEIYTILNDVIWGNPQKALKKMEKLNNPNGNADVEELTHFVKANCYKLLNDQDNYLKEKQLVTRIDLVNQL